MQKRIISVMIMMLLAVVSINAADNKLPRIAVVEFNINNSENYGLRHDALTVRDLVQSNIVKDRQI